MTPAGLVADMIRRGEFVQQIAHRRADARRAARLPRAAALTSARRCGPVDRRSGRRSPSSMRRAALPADCRSQTVHRAGPTAPRSMAALRRAARPRTPAASGTMSDSSSGRTTDRTRRPDAARCAAQAVSRSHGSKRRLNATRSSTATAAACSGTITKDSDGPASQRAHCSRPRRTMLRRRNRSAAVRRAPRHRPMAASAAPRRSWRWR